MEGLLLGLASGITCLAYCAPVLTPFMLGQGDRVGRNTLVLIEFLAGRLLGYLLFGALAWGLGRMFINESAWQSCVKGAAFVSLALMMLIYTLVKNPPKTCVFPSTKVQGWLLRWPAAMPWGLGFFTGLNLCPPFLLALTHSAYINSLPGTLFFFLAFFVGTSIYMLPLPLVGLFRSRDDLRTIGRMTAGLMALYYGYLGSIAILGGVVQQ